MRLWIRAEVRKQENISYLPTAADTVKDPVKRNGNVAHNNNFNILKKITSSIRCK